MSHTPPHGGYPTPRYEEAPMRRRVESMRMSGHVGAHSSVPAEQRMQRAGEGRAELPTERLTDLIVAATMQRAPVEWPF